MKYKSAIGISVLTYVVSMVLGMVACAIMGIKPDMTQPIPIQMWIVSAVLAVILSVAGTYWYFQGKNLRPSLGEGLRFGAVMILTGFVLDLIFFLTLLFDNYDPLTVMLGYYAQPPFWISLILILLGTGLMSRWLEKKK